MEDDYGPVERHERHHSLDGRVDNLASRIARLENRIAVMEEASRSRTETITSIVRRLDEVSHELNNAKMDSAIARQLITAIRDDVTAVRADLGNLRKLGFGLLVAVLGAVATFVFDSALEYNRTKDATPAWQSQPYWERSQDRMNRGPSNTDR